MVTVLSHEMIIVLNFTKLIVSGAKKNLTVFQSQKRGLSLLLLILKVVKELQRRCGLIQVSWLNVVDDFYIHLRYQIYLISRFDML